MTVLSSTSNSNERLPDGPWGKTWLCGLILAGLMLGGYELTWRLRGFIPSAVDNGGLWCLTRSRLMPHDPDQVVLIGSSRSRLDIDCDEFARWFGGRKPVQLSVDGSSCLPVLRQLSLDETFLGTVVCDVVPEHFFAGEQSDLQGRYVAEYPKRNSCALFEQSLRLQIQANLVFRLPGVAPSLVLRAAAGRRLPKPYFLITRPDRSGKADFSRCPDLAAQEQSWIDGMKRIHTRANARAVLNEVEMIVERFQSRGARVVFVLLPTSGRYRAVSEAVFPPAEYWDKLVRRTSALTICFSDYPALAGFHCPEGSHLDYRDGRVFTQFLASILHAKLEGECQPRARIQPVVGKPCWGAAISGGWKCEHFLAVVAHPLVSDLPKETTQLVMTTRTAKVIGLFRPLLSVHRPEHVAHEADNGYQDGDADNPNHIRPLVRDESRPAAPKITANQWPEQEFTRFTSGDRKTASSSTVATVTDLNVSPADASVVARRIRQIDVERIL
jgi:hypothetical protein